MHVFMHICNVLHFTKSLKANQDNGSRGFPQRDFIVQLLQRPAGSDVDEIDACRALL